MASEYKLVLRHVDEAGYTNDIKCYQKHGGYKTMKKVFKLKAKKTKNGAVTPQEVIRKEVLTSGLRGRGGAGVCGFGASGRFGGADLGAGAARAEAG